MPQDREQSYDAVLGLGSNLGDRRAALARAAAAIGALPNVEILGCSRIYETPPAGGPAQEDYLNAALRVVTVLPPEELLAALLAIERAQGRVRPDPVRWGPRVIDIDVLWMSSGAFSAPSLTVPHPRLAERPFAVQPLVDVAPEARDPLSGARYADLPAARASIRMVGALEVAPVPDRP
jgi:2-amino-4-hydroxy-6-hydroxymethyldihydropteridine diphosphokinase